MRCISLLYAVVIVLAINVTAWLFLGDDVLGVVSTSYLTSALTAGVGLWWLAGFVMDCDGDSKND